MRYLYAIYNPNLRDHLIFFGEDHTKSIKTRRGRRPKTIQTSSHLRAMEYEDLLLLLSGPCPANNIKPFSITLLLLAIGTIPFSPDNSLPDTDISFISFQYPGITYPLDKLSSLLPSLGQNTHDGVIITDSIVFFQKAFGFALEFTSRECFLPEVAENIALTRTSVENRLTELWSIMEFLNPDYLGAENIFERKYNNFIEKYHNKGAAEQLSLLVKPFILRRGKTDRSIIADLPEKNVMRRYFTLTTEQTTLYQAMIDSILSEVDDAEGITRRAKILTALLRLKQICNHPDAFLDDGNLIPDRFGKISLLFSLLEEVLAIGEAAILFTQFTSFGERLVGLMERTFKEEGLFLQGKTPRKVRDEMVQQFSHPHGPKLFVLSLKAGGVCLNHTRANHLFHVDR